jgi:hypothetical protein
LVGTALLGRAWKGADDNRNSTKPPPHEAIVELLFHDARNVTIARESAGVVELWL